MKLGILGAGQLGRMLALAGIPLDIDFVLLDPAADACAAGLGEHLCAPFEDHAALATLADKVDVATLEFENVNAEAAAALAAMVPLYPPPKALLVAQDRAKEKALFAELGVPVPGNRCVDSLADLEVAVAALGLPAVLKTRRLGYDGKGQAVLREGTSLTDALASLGGKDLILEAFVPFERELSCLAVRAQNGDMVFYPVVQNQHRDGILRVSIPQANDPLQKDAEDYARRVAEHLDYVGVLAFEFFVRDGQLLANEIAPRVHNSGHWTIEGARCSQFENHVRAVVGLPLGSTELREHVAMINLIGNTPPRADVIAVPGAHLHWYGKAPKPLRKIGHITVTASSAEALQQRLALLMPIVERYAV